MSLSYPNIMLKASALPVDEKSEKSKINLCSAIFLILGVTFNGSGISLLAYQFHLVGIALGALLFATSSLFNVFSCFLIIETAEQVQASSYQELAARTIGKKCGSRSARCIRGFAALLNSVCLIGAAVAGLVFNKNVASTSFETLGDQAPGFARSTVFWTFAFVLTMVLPMLSCPKVNCLKNLSFFTTALSICYVVICIWSVTVFELPAAHHV